MRICMQVSVAPLMPAAKAGVAPGDVVTKLDGLEVAEDGTVQALPGLRLPWEYCITKKPCGEAVELEISRDGHLHTASVELVPQLRLVLSRDHATCVTDFTHLTLPSRDYAGLPLLTRLTSHHVILTRLLTDSTSD